MSEAPARERALRLLARREHSARELAAKLERAGVPAEEARRTVRDLAAAGLQSDARFAEVFVRSRAGRGQGPFRIERELQQHGVEDATIRRHLSEGAYDWPALAGEALRKRFGPAPAQDFRERARRHRFLAQRGFEHAQIEQAIARLERRQS